MYKIASLFFLIIMLFCVQYSRAQKGQLMLGVELRPNSSVAKSAGRNSSEIGSKAYLADFGLRAFYGVSKKVRVGGGLLYSKQGYNKTEFFKDSIQNIAGSADVHYRYSFLEVPVFIMFSSSNDRKVKPYGYVGFSYQIMMNYKKGVATFTDPNIEFVKTALEESYSGADIVSDTELNRFQSNWKFGLGVLADLNENFMLFFEPNFKFGGSNGINGSKEEKFKSYGLSLGIVYKMGKLKE